MIPKRRQLETPAGRAESAAAPRRRPGRQPFSGADTREMLMDAAEELFADFGIEGVSIRSINLAAGLTAPAVHYHFNTKDRLLDAVLRRRGEDVIARGRELLDELEARRRRPRLRDIFKALAIPYLQLLDRDPIGGARWVRLISRLLVANDPRLGPMDAGLHERFFVLLRQEFPRLTDEQLQTLWLMATGMLIQMVGNQAAVLASGGEPDHGLEALTGYVETLVEFVTSGFAGVAKRQSRRPARARDTAGYTQGTAITRRPTKRKRASGASRASA